MQKPPLLDQPDMDYVKIPGRSHFPQKTKQFSVSCPFYKEPLSWLMKYKSQKWAGCLKCRMLWWTHTSTIPHMRWAQGLFSNFWRIPMFQADSQWPASCQGGSDLVEREGIPQETFCMTKLSSLWRWSSKYQGTSKPGEMSEAGRIKPCSS